MKLDSRVQKDVVYRKPKLKLTIFQESTAYLSRSDENQHLNYKFFQLIEKFHLKAIHFICQESSEFSYHEVYDKFNFGVPGQNVIWVKF